MSATILVHPASRRYARVLKQRKHTRLRAILAKWGDKFALGAMSGRTQREAKMDEPVHMDWRNARKTKEIQLSSPFGKQTIVHQTWENEVSPERRDSARRVAPSDAAVTRRLITQRVDIFVGS